jgi:multidrug resistance efflux pump
LTSVIDLPAARRPVISWRRAAKLVFFAGLLAAGLLVLYQQLVLRVSRDAVINAELAVIRAPIDGIATASVTVPGAAVATGEPLGHIDDPLPDDNRLVELRREASAVEIENAALKARLADLEEARHEAQAQAEAYRLGRVRELQLRVEEARADRAALSEQQKNAEAEAARGAALYARGFQSGAAQDRLEHAGEIARQNVIAAQKRLDALAVDLDAAQTGTFLGDSYNDAPSSLQRARELALRVAETRAALDDAGRKAAALADQLAAEEKHLAFHSHAALAAPVGGRLWTVLAQPGEYVRKGQEILTLLDCSTAVVTAALAERDYNRVRLGDPVRFRVSGSNREYPGQIIKLGSSAAFAIPPVPERQQIVVALSGVPNQGEDSCAVGRTGEVTFEDAGSGIAAGLLGALRPFFGFFAGPPRA